MRQYLTLYKAKPADHNMAETRTEGVVSVTLASGPKTRTTAAAATNA